MFFFWLGILGSLWICDFICICGIKLYLYGVEIKYFFRISFDSLLRLEDYVRNYVKRYEVG